MPATPTLPVKSIRNLRPNPFSKIFVICPHDLPHRAASRQLYPKPAPPLRDAGFLHRIPLLPLSPPPSIRQDQRHPSRLDHHWRYFWRFLLLPARRRLRIPAWPPPCSTPIAISICQQDSCRSPA